MLADPSTIRFSRGRADDRRRLAVEGAALGLLGAGYLGPTAKRIAVVGATTAEGQLLIRSIIGLLRIDLMFLFAIVLAMVVKPTSDDVWVVVALSALLLAGAAITLRGWRARRAPPRRPADRA